jgi:hypothetical protein
MAPSMMSVFCASMDAIARQLDMFVQPEVLARVEAPSGPG